MAGNGRIDNDNGRIVRAAIGLGAILGAGLALWNSYSRENDIQEQPQRRESFQQSQNVIANTISSENDLKIYVKRNIRIILEAEGNPELIYEEWPAPAAHIGRGDLVYHFDGIDYVIELKWIDYEGVNDPNRNRQTVNTANRQKKSEVKEQAGRYGKIWLEQKGRPYDVQAIALINGSDGEYEILEKFYLPCGKYTLTC